MDSKGVAKKLKNKKKIIFVHSNADMDAIGSAYAITKCFPPAVVYAPKGTDRVSSVVSEKFSFEIREDSNFSDYEQIVVVDTSSPDQIGLKNFEFPDDTIVIDHHHPTDKWKCETFIKDDKKSCTQVVLDILRENKIAISKDVGMMLLCGMLTDSAHFQFSDSTLLRDFAFLLEECKIEMDEVMSLTHNDVTMSERVSVLKCLERMKVERVGDMLVASSYVGCYEASGCRALLQAGADVAFVASQREDEFRLSARATQEIVRRGVCLSDIVKDIGKETSTDGGGHDGAAGISGVGDIDAMLHICVQRTMDVFRRIKSKSS